MRKRSCFWGGFCSVTRYTVSVYIRPHNTKLLHVLCNGEVPVIIVPWPELFWDLWGNGSCVHHDVIVNVDGGNTNNYSLDCNVNRPSEGCIGQKRFAGIRQIWNKTWRCSRTRSGKGIPYRYQIFYYYYFYYYYF